MYHICYDWIIIVPLQECKYCKKSFTVYPSSSRMYCSKDCQTKDRTIERTCKTCGKISIVPKSQNRPFCSRKCMVADPEWQTHFNTMNLKDHVIVNCKMCGKPIEVTETKSKRKKYCSRTCRSSDPDIVKKLYRGEMKTTKCAHCGKEITRLKSVFKEGTLAFCNFECMGKYKATNQECLEMLLSASKSAGLSPNKLEKHIANHYGRLRFVGDGSLWIDVGNGRKKCPDFILPGTNKLVELWGDYWHKDQIPSESMELYKRAGYECLVLWEHEIRKDWRNTVMKINQFLAIGS